MSPPHATHAMLQASAVELEKLDDKVLMKLANAAFKGEGTGIACFYHCCQ